MTALPISLPTASAPSSSARNPAFLLPASFPSLLFPPSFQSGFALPLKSFLMRSLRDSSFLMHFFPPFTLITLYLLPYHSFISAFLPSFRLSIYTGPSRKHPRHCICLLISVEFHPDGKLRSVQELFLRKREWRLSRLWIDPSPPANDWEDIGHFILQAFLDFLACFIAYNSFLFFLSFILLSFCIEVLVFFPGFLLPASFSGGGRERKGSTGCVRACVSSLLVSQPSSGL